MTGHAQSEMTEIAENRYATCRDFLKIFDEDMPALYQLSFLLTGDHRKGERCFVGGMEDCARENGVFLEWARSWAKRAIVQNAIHELRPQRPQRSHSGSPALPQTAVARGQSCSEPFAVDAVLGLADFERFVFVLCVLERYREHDCALLLGCSASEVRAARTEAIAQLADCGPNGLERYESRKRDARAHAIRAEAMSEMTAPALMHR